MKRYLPAVAVLAVLALLPPGAPSDAGPATPAPWRCGTELSPEDVAAFEAREAQFGPLVMPQNAPAPPWCVPIAAHIIRTSSGSGGLSLARLNQGITDCNTAYANTGIKFLLLSVDYIDSDAYYNDVDTDAEIDAMIQQNVVAEAINVYFTPNLANEDGGLCGRGSFTTSSPQGVAMNNDCTGTAGNPSTFPHELGHFFDLYHTHETAFGAELVDGSNCGSAGDKLCDTPADPKLDEGTNINSSCSYYGTETDGNGDSYNPDTHQLMSYAPKTCRDAMSPQSESKVAVTLLVLRLELLNRGCAPTADAGANIVAECTSPTTTPVMLDGSGSSDPEGAALTYAWTASGVTFNNSTLQKPTGNFPFGTTTVQLIVSDGTYSDTATVDVKVQDTTPPTIVCPADVTVECSSHCGVVKGDPQLTTFFAGVSATDVCDTSPTITNDAPACFSLGETTVTFTAEDDHGNKSTCTAKVTVADTTPPEIDVVLSRDYLWPPNHKMAEVCADVVVTDICDPNPTFVLLSVESNEPDNGKGDGNTINDIQNASTGTPDLCVNLRSERLGGGNGRKYTIIYQAMDMSGNTAEDTVCVRVVHDQSGHALASAGFSATGKEMESGAGQIAIVIPAKVTMDATQIDPRRTYLGNTRGVALPTRTRIADVNGDGRNDLILFYPASQVSWLAGGAWVIEHTSYDGNGPDPGGQVLPADRGDGPVGLHYVTPAGASSLVNNIFALGAPVPLPIIWINDGPATITLVPTPEPEAGARSLETKISSIHPNPFNPQTTVAFELSVATRVRIMIYDVRGALVRSLVDNEMAPGTHSAVWSGVDDSGRPATSGIYFVRMTAGTHTEVRKIVMLK